MAIRILFLIIFINLSFFLNIFAGNYTATDFNQWINSINNAIDSVPAKIKDNQSISQIVDDIQSLFPLNYSDYCFNAPYDIIYYLEEGQTYNLPKIKSLPSEIFANYYKDKQLEILQEYHETLEQIKSAQEKIAKKKYVAALTIFKNIIEYNKKIFDMLPKSPNPKVLSLINNMKNLYKKAQEDAKDLEQKIQSIQDEKKILENLENLRNNLVNTMHYLRLIEYDVVKNNFDINKLVEMINDCNQLMDRGVLFAEFVKEQEKNIPEISQGSVWSGSSYAEALENLKGKFSQGALSLDKYLSERNKIIQLAQDSYNKSDKSDDSQNNYNNFYEKYIKSITLQETPGLSNSNGKNFDKDVLQNYYNTRYTFTKIKDKIYTLFDNISTIIQTTDLKLSEYKNDLNFIEINPEINKYDYLKLDNIKEQLYNIAYISEKDLMTHISNALQVAKDMFTAASIPEKNFYKYYWGNPKWITVDDNETKNKLSIFVSPVKLEDIDSVMDNINILADDIKNFPNRYLELINELKDNINILLNMIIQEWNNLMSYQSNPFIHKEDYILNNKKILSNGCKFFIFSPLCNLSTTNLNVLDIIKKMLEEEFNNAKFFKYLLDIQASKALEEIDLLNKKLIDIKNFNTKIKSKIDELNSDYNYLREQYYYISNYLDSFSYPGMRVDYRVFLNMMCESSSYNFANKSKSAITEILTNMRRNLQKFYIHYDPAGIGKALELITEILTNLYTENAFPGGKYPLLDGDEELINTLKKLVQVYFPEESYYYDKRYKLFFTPNQIEKGFPNYKSVFYYHYNEVSHYKIKVISGNNQIGESGYFLPFLIKIQLLDTTEDPPKPVAYKLVEFYMKADGKPIKTEEKNNANIKSMYINTYGNTNNIDFYTDYKGIAKWKAMTDVNGMITFQWRVDNVSTYEAKKWELVAKYFGPTEDSFAHLYAVNKNYISEDLKNKLEQFEFNAIDSDNDGLLDKTEYLLGTNPLLPDSDNDGISDGFEVLYNLNPLDASDAAKDYDNDSVTNIDEFKNGTSPVDTLSSPLEIMKNKYSNISELLLNIKLNKGWNLKSTPMKSSLDLSFLPNDIIVWKWSKFKWLIATKDENLLKILEKYKIETFNNISYGEGFWIKSDKEYTIDLSNYSDIKYGVEIFKDKSFSDWSLLGVGDNVSVQSLESAIPNLATIWLWRDNTWELWSPDENIIDLLTQYNIPIVDVINRGEGFWINAK